MFLTPACLFSNFLRLISPSCLQTGATSDMIPRAVDKVFRVADELKSKGWEYKMEDQLLEIVGKLITFHHPPRTLISLLVQRNDQLPPWKDEFDKKHEIKHDTKTDMTHVTDVNTITLHCSSRSHSVCTLRISGANRASVREEFEFSGFGVRISI
jgi:kinesin family protein C1